MLLSGNAWWQVYLDNFMTGELVDHTHAEHNAALQSLTMEAWRKEGVPTADKQVVDAAVITELGVQIDGKHGLLGCSP